MSRPQAIVTLDQGNSSTKAVIYSPASGEEIAAEVISSRHGVERLRQLLSELDVDAVIGCSVAQGRDLSELMAIVDAPAKMTLDSATPVPLRNLYASPATLGADRMAAAVGAAALLPGEELLVADIGTACTFDCVSSAGEFLGGNISPGPGMRLRALNRFTARLPLVSGHAESIPAFGRSTEEALRCGAMRGVVAELLYYSGYGRRRHIVLSGGWAPEIAALLPDDVRAEVRPHLVNEGLLNILKFNLQTIEQ